MASQQPGAQLQSRAQTEFSPPETRSDEKFGLAEGGPITTTRVWWNQGLDPAWASVSVPENGQWDWPRI